MQDSIKCKVCGKDVKVTSRVIDAHGPYVTPYGNSKLLCPGSGFDFAKSEERKAAKANKTQKQK